MGFISNINAVFTRFLRLKLRAGSYRKSRFDPRGNLPRRWGFKMIFSLHEYLTNTRYWHVNNSELATAVKCGTGVCYTSHIAPVISHQPCKLITLIENVSISEFTKALLILPLNAPRVLPTNFRLACQLLHSVAPFCWIQVIALNRRDTPNP